MGIDGRVVEGLFTVAEISTKQFAELKGAIHAFRLQKYDRISHGRQVLQIFSYWLAALAWLVGGLRGPPSQTNLSKCLSIRWDGFFNQLIG